MQQVILIEKSIVINVTPAKLYKALTNAKELTRWFCDRAESDPHEGGTVVNVWGEYEGRGTYKRLIPNQEVAIQWESEDIELPEDLTIYRLEKTPKGTRVTVVDFALPEELEDLSAGWDYQLKQLKKTYQTKPAVKKATSTKKATSKRRTTTKAKATTRKPKASSPKTKRK